MAALERRIIIDGTADGNNPSHTVREWHIFAESLVLSNAHHSCSVTWKHFFIAPVHLLCGSCKIDRWRQQTEIKREECKFQWQMGLPKETCKCTILEAAIVKTIKPYIPSRLPSSSPTDDVASTVNKLLVSSVDKPLFVVCAYSATWSNSAGTELFQAVKQNKVYQKRKEQVVNEYAVFMMQKDNGIWYSYKQNTQ